MNSTAPKRERVTVVLTVKERDALTKELLPVWRRLRSDTDPNQIFHCSLVISAILKLRAARVARWPK